VPTALTRTSSAIHTSAEDTVIGFTLAAAATGAIPVPGASVAIVAENAALVAALGSVYGHEVDAKSVVASLAALSGLNTIGRTVFIEGARLMGWFAGPFGVAGVSALGATTAAVQTWTLGKLAMAYFAGGAQPMSEREARQIAEEAKAEFDLGSVKARHKATARA
jgi:uncharacterized protein (DUF697 family)